MTIEEQLRNLIIEKYGSVTQFASVIGVPGSTIASILSRGIHKSSIDNVLAMCKALQISADEIAHDRIVSIFEATAAYPTDIEVFVQQAQKHIAKGMTYHDNPLTPEELKTLIIALQIGLDMIK